MKPNLRFYAVAPFGLEPLVADELSRKAPGAASIRAERGGVYFEGTAETAMAACLHSRFASRILLLAAQHEYWDTRDILEAARRTKWERWFGPDQTIRLDVSVRNCPLESVDFAMLRVKDGICDRFRELCGRRPSVDRRHPDVRIHVHITYKQVFFYLDLAGESLFKRGWRLEHGEAPLKENMAAALLALAEWTPEKTLVDPFCGSGTIAVEAAAIAANVAPGLHRGFAFEALDGFDAEVWREMKEDARAAVNLHAPVRIAASDISSIVVEKALENARRAGFGAMIEDGRLTFSAVDAREALPPEGAEPGLVVANPPYGEQSNPKSASIRSMMKGVADNLKAHFSGWTVWMLSSDRSLPSQMRLKESRKIVLFNGPLECRFFRFAMVAGSNRRKPAEDAPSA